MEPSRRRLHGLGVPRVVPGPAWWRHRTGSRLRRRRRLLRCGLLFRRVDVLSWERRKGGTGVVDGALGRVQEGALLASSGLGLVNFLIRVLRGRVLWGRLRSLPLQLVRGRVCVTDRRSLWQMAVRSGALRRRIVLVLLALKLLQLLFGVAYVLALLELLLELLLLLGRKVELSLLEGLASRNLL